MESENPRISWHFFSLTNSSVAPALTDTETLEAVISCLTEHIPVETQGACDQQTLFHILVTSSKSWGQY